MAVTWCSKPLLTARCPLNLAPTASTAVAMAIGDALAAVWMERRASPADFALVIGWLLGKLTMTVADLMVPAANLRAITAAPLPDVISTLTQGAIGSSWWKTHESRGAGADH